MSNWYTQSKRSNRRSRRSRRSSSNKTWNENSLRKTSQTIVDGLRRLAHQNPRLRGNIRAILSGINSDGRRTARKTYDKWIKEVDRYIQKKAMMSYRDLPDQPYRRWFDSGMSAKEAADMAIERSGGGMFGL